MSTATSTDRYTVERGQYGVWVKDLDKGRSRFIECDPDKFRLLDLATLEKTRRAYKEGTHEPMTLIRDENGKLGVPPQPDCIPDGCTAFTINSLQEADAVAREMREDLRNTWKDEGDFTRALDEAMGGDPRAVLLHNMQYGKGDIEREVCRSLIEILDAEEDNRRRVAAELHFRWRES
jgi:hypothetical protein